MDIDSDRQLSGPVMKAQSVLDQWYRSNGFMAGFMASHKMLIEAFVNQGDADLAERVCRIAKKGQKTVVHSYASFDFVMFTELEDALKCLQN